MSYRFYVDQRVSSGQVRLAGAEARHLAKVMRASVGDRVVLFDGEGDEFDARVAQLDKSGVLLDVVTRRQADRELPFVLNLGVALPKGDRQRWLVEKAVELGVTRLTPLKTVRGVAQPTGPVLQRLARTVIEASKQCGRNRLMELASPQSMAQYAAAAAGAAGRWLADPTGVAVSALFAAAVACHDAAQPIWLAVGPEGGFAPEEIALVQSCGWRRVRLGPRILRVETAAVALASLCALAHDRADDGVTNRGEQQPR